jgi:hypothetical protein
MFGNIDPLRERTLALVRRAAAPCPAPRCCHPRVRKQTILAPLRQLADEAVPENRRADLCRAARDCTQVRFAVRLGSARREAFGGLGQTAGP